MTDIRTAMKLISGAEPTPQRVQHVQAIAHTLGFAPNDPMMAILISLDCYYQAFSELPAKAQLAANQMAAGAEKQSRAAIDKAIAESASTLAPVAEKAFAKGVERYCDALDRTAREKSMGWAAKIGGLVLVSGLVIGCAFGYFGKSFSDNSALDQALTAAAAATMAKTKAETDAAAAIAAATAAADARAEEEVKLLRAPAGWLGTKDGQLAYKFFTNGDGRMAAKCEGSMRWEKFNTGDGKHLCVPMSDGLFSWKSGTTGWVIP